MKLAVFPQIWTFYALFAISSGISWSDQMSCSYGTRGSLTAVCVNATSYYFKLTNYRFDYLDETLLCVNCSLNSLDQGTFDIPGNEIRTLDIRNSSISKIWPKAFIGMIYMENLLLAHNPIDQIYPEAFLGVRKVKHLDMANTVSNLEPKVFQELYLLSKLKLNNNKLKEIKPGTFEGLRNLKYLDLSHNQLQHINNSFDPLINLKILLLENNFISKLYGDEFNQLHSLRLLNLNSNNVTNFTTNLPPDNNLRTLLLSSNVLNVNSFKTNTFANLNALEVLDLSSNTFENITVKLFQGLFRLRNIFLNNNSITEITTGSFAGMPHLRVMNVSENKIQTLKVTGRFTLPSLVSLDVSSNKITDFDYMSLITRAPKLKHIDLRHNGLSCKLVGQLEGLFEYDSISYYISEHPEITSCPKLERAAASHLVQEFVEKLEYQYINNTLLVWMFILLTIVILLLGVLFYVQFFIVLRVGVGLYGNVKILNNLGLRRNNENV